MTSRLSLSLLAAVFGAALMYLLLAQFGAFGHFAIESYARIGVAGGLMVLLIGWLRIYRSRSLRPQPVSPPNQAERRVDAEFRRVA